MARQTTSLIYEDLRLVDADRLRRLVRMGAYEGHTGGLARGKLQANVAIVPRSFAGDFHQFCVRNPKPCPLVGVSRTGSPLLPGLGDIDIRTDAPQYNIYCFGEMICQKTDIIDLWRDDFAAFALGSSLTVEAALAEKGVKLRRIGCGKASPKFRTRIETCRVGPFGGEMVVSMRPVKQCDVDKVRALTARFPQAHGSPIHVGEPAIIGISDLMAPDWGDAVEILEGEVPVFWASSLTAQDALARAELAISITVSPGHMLITDVDAQAHAGPVDSLRKHGIANRWKLINEIKSSNI
ncbi:D-glutamate cyclase family protein [Mesorhizobium sp. ArgA1]